MVFGVVELGRLWDVGLGSFAEVQVTADATQRTTRAQWPRRPHKQNNALSGDTGEQEPSGLGHRTHVHT